MKLWTIILKSFREQYRSFWILLLILSMGPFFMSVYFLILDSSKPNYVVAVVNNDTGAMVNGIQANKGEEFITFFTEKVSDQETLPFSIRRRTDREMVIGELKNKKINAAVIIPGSFSTYLTSVNLEKDEVIPEVEFIGDLTDVSYLLSAIWANESLNSFIKAATGSEDIISVAETGLGISSRISDFEMVVPGILILSVIMLMFTAAIAFVSEVENKTIIRLKLSPVTAAEYIAGTTIVQLLVGIVSILLTLATATILGFEFRGSAFLFLLIAALTSLSIIAFSLIIAALTKTAGEILVVGNFPLFLFMFFTGAAFPFRSEGFLSLFGYPVTLQGLMSPTHAIAALNKILVMEMNFTDIIPEVIVLVILTILYFFVGMVLFRIRHMTLK